MKTVQKEKKRKISHQLKPRKKINLEEKEEEEERDCGPLQPKMKVGELVPFIKNLEKKKVDDWEEEEVLKVVEVMKNRVAISISYKEDKKSLRIYESWRDKWESYVKKNPKIEKLLDPWYLIIKYDNDLEDFDDSLDEIDNLIDFETIKEGILYSFRIKSDAKYFLGFCNGRYPGRIYGSIFSSTTLEQYE